MRTKSRFSRWLKAAAVLAVAECAGVAVVQAQSSSRAVSEPEKGIPAARRYA